MFLTGSFGRLRFPLATGTLRAAPYKDEHPCS